MVSKAILVQGLGNRHPEGRKCSICSYQPHMAVSLMATTQPDMHNPEAGEGKNVSGMKSKMRLLQAAAKETLEM
eukprot:4307339-Amphidinium_carterae.1